MKSKVYKVDIDFGCGDVYSAKLKLHTTTYRNNGTLAVYATEGNEDFADITVNLPDSMFVCDEKTAFVDTNNCPWAEKFLKENGIAKPTGDYGHSGWCSYPLYEFNLSLFK
jgi:hypothetical protein